MKNKYYMLIGIVLISFLLLGTTGPSESVPKEYRISTDVHTINGKIWIFETKYNVHSGKIISRKQVSSKKYRNIK
tara:strand:- start:525 stop:749 length:225 start_codon:yes stop_codon:yes gene_type:complete